MSFRIKIASFLVFIISNYTAYAQVPGSEDDKLVQTIKIDFDSLKSLKGDEAKRLLNAVIVGKLEEILRKPESFHFAFDSLKLLGKVSAPDNAFRILNWNLSFDDFSYSYITFMQLNPSGKFGYKLIQIKDTRPKIDLSIQNKQFSKDDWYGGLIYKILLDNYKHQNYYTFFALDHNNMMSQFKFIDVITFDGKGDPIFGKAIFKTPKSVFSRVIFEYSSQVVMGLKYDEKLKMIVFDHLSPNRPELTGDFKFYGPDFSYDAFKFEDGFWIFQSDIRLSNAPPVIIKERQVPKE